MPFLPHAWCLRSSAPLVAMTAVSHWCIWAAYMLIPVFMFKASNSQGRHLRISLMFKAFILLCGIGHLIASLTLWWPYYWFEATWNVATAIVSLGTAWHLGRNMQSYMLMLNWQHEHQILLRRVAEIEEQLPGVGPDAGQHTG